MIVWIASYPKSGNTWIRALLSAYLYSNDGVFDFKLLNNMPQFPTRQDVLEFTNNFQSQVETSKYWIKAQKKINSDKKIHFLKTHSSMCTLEGNSFTDKENTIACIYVVRDPRNVITSLANHYEFSTDEAFEFLTNERKIIFDTEYQDYGDIQFIGDWANHYKSWKNLKIASVKIIKYEDFIENNENTFIDLLNFLKKFMTININKKKLKNVITSTDFSILQSKEKKFGFEESILSKKNKNKIKFFNLGRDNNWKNFLDINTEKKIVKTFTEEMKELNYINSQVNI